MKTSKKTKIVNRALPCVLAFFALSTSLSAFAHFEVLNTGDVMPEGRVRAITGPQFLTGEGSGLNLVGAFDLGYNKDSDVRINAGFGTTDFHFGGSYKWAPIPDINKQPALGLIFGTTYAHFDGSNEFSLRAIPVVSKKFHTNLGQFNPYFSLPVALTVRSGDEEFPMHVVFGSEFKPKDLNHPWSFVAEVGFNLNDTFSHVTLGWIFAIENLSIVRTDTRERSEETKEVIFPDNNK